MAGPQGYDFSDVDKLNEEEHYTSLPQKALAAVEGVGRGATLNASDYGEAATGLTSKENIQKREEYNPGTSLAGEAVGAGGLVYVTGGIAAPAEEALLAAKVAPAAARAAAFATEGAAYTAGTNVVDATLGDAKLNGQKIAADMGMAALLGGGLGLLSKGLEARLGAKARAMHEASAEVKASQLPESIAGDLKNPSQDPSAILDPEFGYKPKSLEDLESKIREASYRGETPELPTSDVLKDAVSRTEMHNPVLDMQLESLSGQDARNTYNIAKESSGKTGQLIKDYEAIQKSELVQRTDNAIKDLHPERAPIADATKNGESAIKAFSDQYQAEKEMLGPHFEALKNTDLSDMNHLPGVLDKMTDAVPGVAKMFDTTGDTLKIQPYKTKWGIDKSTYSAVKEAMESLEGGPKSFEELQNIRKGLDQNVDILSQGQGPREIMALKKSMMDYMQDALSTKDYAFNVREIFKRYAINEQERGVIERAFGASVGSPEFGAMSKVKPEEVLDKIFKNTATVKAAKNILPPEQFNEMLANHLAEQRAKVTDKGIFSSNKFGSYLKKTSDVLNEAFSSNPNQLQKIKDLNNIARILPDAPSINPSGTAKTLMGLLKAHSITDLIGNVKEYLHEAVHEKILARKVNEQLAGKAETAEKMSDLAKIIDKTTKRIDSSAKAIFNKGSYNLGITAPMVRSLDKEYEKNIKRIQEVSFNPQNMMEHLGNSSKEMSAIAPNITDSLHNTAIAATQFLASKIPVPKTQFPLSKEFKPSEAQKYKFNTYFRIVEDPISVFSDIKHGSLTNENMEALRAVHPDLLQSMRESIFEQFDHAEAKILPYQTKMSLTKFLGQALDEHMLPQVINSYQAAMLPQAQPQGQQETKKTRKADLEKSDRASTKTNQEEEV